MLPAGAALQGCRVSEDDARARGTEVLSRIGLSFRGWFQGLRELHGREGQEDRSPRHAKEMGEGGRPARGAGRWLQGFQEVVHPEKFLGRQMGKERILHVAL